MSTDTPNGRKLGLAIIAVIASAIVTTVTVWATWVSRQSSDHETRIRINERELQRIHDAAENRDVEAGD